MTCRRQHLPEQGAFFVLTLQGEKRLNQSLAEVWPRLTSLQFLVECLPDLHAIKSIHDMRAEAVLRPGFSFARSEMQLQIDKVEVSPPTSAQFTFATKGIGSSSLVDARFRLVDGDSGCAVHWSADVRQLGGLLKAVPAGLIQAGAERVINDLLGKIEQRLNEPT
jgi:carbon monoxide dehydrogenase subunit G